MSLQNEEEIDAEPRNMKDMKLSKYGFGLKLKSFTSMLGWTGMILSTVMGVASLIMLFYPIDFQFKCTSHHRLACGLMMGFAVFFLILAVLWFYLSFILRKNNKLNDLVKVTKILKVFCYIQGAITILLWVLIMTVIYILVDNVELIYYLPYILIIPSVMASILMIIGVARTKLRLVSIYITYSLVMVIIYVLIDIGFYVAQTVVRGSGLLILFGLLESFGFVLFSVYWNGFIVTLHTIMETNINKFRVFKNNNIDSSTIQLVE